MGMERPLVLIKDNKQPCEELSFSLSLRQKGSCLTSVVSLFELAGGAKSRRQQVDLGSGDTRPVLKSQQVHLQVPLCLPIPWSLCSVLDSGAL